ncbi:VOC family protein [Pararhodonellum marinum]|uniref:VOC family protein n=1 Tax=Pararhodonellum marinum TaxID=2755358 RepID=UPI00293BE9DE|nr:VOC family protein [Pararhodonellum marinum]
MKKSAFIILGLILSFGLGFYLQSIGTELEEVEINPRNLHSDKQNNTTMKIGAFSVSLSVKDLNTSKAFYEKLGFTSFAGDISQNYLIMKNENSVIGLFYGMFEGNILTFNPGWDQNAQNIDHFVDIREIQQHLKDNGIPVNPEVDESTTGPGSFMVTDPDGNVLLFDQHR